MADRNPSDLDREQRGGSNPSELNRPEERDTRSNERDSNQSERDMNRNRGIGNEPGGENRNKSSNRTP